MTPIDEARADIEQRVRELNEHVEQYRSEGLTFSFSADPAFVGVGLQVPVARELGK